MDVHLSTFGWEQVEKRLDKELPVKEKKDRRRFFWLLFLFLLAGGSGLVWILNDKTVGHTTPKRDTNALAIQPDINPNIVKEKNRAPAIDNTLPIGEKKSNNNIQPKHKITDSKKLISPIKEKIAENSKSDRANQLVTVSNIPVVSNKKLTAVAKKNKRTIVYNNQLSFQPTAKNNFYKKSKGVPSGNEDRKNKNNIADNNLTELQSTSAGNTDKKQATANTVTSPVPAVDTSATNNKTANLNVKQKSNVEDTTTKNKQSSIIAVNKNKKPGKAAFNRFALGLVTGMDYSNIKGTGDKTAGYTIGLQLSYAFSKRLSINSGMLITKKFYSAKGEDFHPPKHYWTTYVDLKSVIGNCNMWDMPLNIRYNFIIKPSTTWYINSGISSYIMRKQSYTYNYNYNNLPTSRKWQTSSQENDWLKVANISAGVEKKINRSFTLQVEPYMKLPLKGLGFGDMNISSYGILVGIKYWPTLKKK